MQCKPTQLKLCGLDNCKICFNRSFASYNDKTRNGKLKIKCIDDIKNKIQNIKLLSKKSSKHKLWFTCDICYHSFQNRLDHVSNGHWCPYCCNRTLCGSIDCQICYDKSFESYKGITKKGTLIKDLWDINKNKIEKIKVTKGTHVKYYFTCDQCNHSFDIAINKITGSNRWCPYCCNATKLCDDIKCNYCYKKSFASIKDTKKLESWDNKKNKDKPNNITKYSTQKRWFICYKCNHEFLKHIGAISNGGWCPYCSDYYKKLCEENCKHCFKNSLASYKGKTKHNKLKIDCWNHEKNKDKPRNICRTSKTNIWFNCDNCNHVFETQVIRVTRGSWCPYCCFSSRLICKNKKCQYCFNKTFESYDKITSYGKLKRHCWDYNKNNDKPIDIFKCCAKKRWFICDDCNISFKIRISEVFRGTWCSKCKYKTEKKFLYWIQNMYTNYTIKHQATFVWCKNKKTNRYLKFDIYVKELNLLIEIDGEQHFSQVSNWQSHLLTKKRDKYKMKKSIKNGFTIVRLLQDDIFNDKCNWRRKVKDIINNINSNKYKKPLKIYCNKRYKDW